MFVLVQHKHSRSQVAAGDSHRNMAVGYVTEHIVELKAVVQLFVDIHNVNS
jgi:hypothetical protein